MARGRCALLLAALLLGGCASVQDVTGVATQQDLLQLRTDVTIAQQRAQRALGEAEPRWHRRSVASATVTGKPSGVWPRWRSASTP